MQHQPCDRPYQPEFWHRFDLSSAATIHQSGFRQHHHVGRREPSLESQAADATTGHAQASTPPTSAQVAQIVAFERVYSQRKVRTSPRVRWMRMAQPVGRLIAGYAGGVLPGINDPLGGNPHGTPFTNNIFTLYRFLGVLDRAPCGMARATIVRGQAVFNTKPIAITGVTGINDVLGVMPHCRDSAAPAMIRQTSVTTR